MTEGIDAHLLAETAGDTRPKLPITMDKRVDLALALGTTLLGASTIWLATGFRIGNFPDPLTARGLPYILGGFMVVGGLVLAGRRFADWTQLPGHLVVSEGAEDELGHPASALCAGAVMACSFLWAALLHPIGYLLVTPLCIAGMLFAMKVRSTWQLILFPAGFTLVTWIIFAQALNVLLPLGPLAPLARRLGLMY
ncbi:MAG: tripartite tricarboxylate transporter TctB family protein [Rhodobacteraceae bacterium]|nr:tripartite tricarboxylate transporter TctB family protein [Paracoccaceae bacterium]